MAKRTRIRLAIAGCGRVTQQHHLPAALGSNVIDVVALVDSDPARARDVARKYGVEIPVTAHLEETLDGVDGVLVATPNHLHAPLARMALVRKIPTLIEKPLTTCYEEALELCRLAEDSGTFISVGYCTRHFPSVVLMKDLIERGVLGLIRSFQYEYGSRGGWSPVSSFNLDKKRAGGGVLIDSGTHFIDRMLYWFGTPSELTYEDDSHGGVEANCRCRLRFERPPDGFEGTIVLSKTMALGNKVSISADRYVCELDEGEPDLIVLYPRGMPGVRMTVANDGPREGARDYFQAQVEDFARAILEGGSPRVDGWSGARSVGLIAQMYARRRQMEEPWLCQPCALEIAG